MTAIRHAIDIAPFPFPVLIGDVGGTMARFATIADPAAPIGEPVVLSTKAWRGPAEAIRSAVLADGDQAPRTLLLAVAGPVGKEGARLTNANWTIDPAGLLAELGLEEIVILNDFEALALALPTLALTDLKRIGSGEGRVDRTRVVVGPGTGLGVAALVPAGGRFVPVSSEGGHIAFGPETEEEFTLWPHLPRFHGRVSAEALLTGDGLGRIHTGLTRRDGRSDGLQTGEAVTEAAETGDPLAREAITHFSRWLGRFCGDAALLYLARGGVFVGGGVVPRLGALFDDAAFRTAFDDKAPMDGLVRKIPAFVILKDKPAFGGLADFARDPNRFSISLVGRRIRA